MAVAAANCINIPVMRQRELIDGVMVTDREGNDLAQSKVSWQSHTMTHQRLKTFYLFSGGSAGWDISGHHLKD